MASRVVCWDNEHTCPNGDGACVFTFLWLDSPAALRLEEQMRTQVYLRPVEAVQITRGRIFPVWQVVLWQRAHPSRPNQQVWAFTGCDVVISHADESQVAFIKVRPSTACWLHWLFAKDSVSDKRGASTSKRHALVSGASNELQREETCSNVIWISIINSQESPSMVRGVNQWNVWFCKDQMKMCCAFGMNLRTHQRGPIQIVSAVIVAKWNGHLDEGAKLRPRCVPKWSSKWSQMQCRAVT